MTWRFALAVLPASLLVGAPNGRVTVSLDGAWEIADSVSSAEVPKAFAHKVQVPGLVNLARPAFPDVDRFDSRELIDNKIRRKLMPASERTTEVGRSRQKRNYFWYRTTFRPVVKKQVATLRVGKAQFGTAVFVNGKPAGEHLGCFTAGYFDVTTHLNWSGDNEILIRIGGHPGVLPPNIPAGTDFEKLKWTPGIYDSVSLILTDSALIESVQVAPRIARSEALIQTKLSNRGTTPATFPLTQRVGGATATMRVTLKPGEDRTVEQTLKIPTARLWSPEDPFLYKLETTYGPDGVSTRFGMREFRFDTATRRAYLNNKLYFLRGSNITLHRFFEDPKAGALAWDEKWVRRLLVDLPKKMHWNSFRFCIGPVPDKWLEIADEAGLLIQHEYFIWTGPNAWHKEYDEKTLTTELSEWVRDSWNHPSVVIWDAANETIADVLGDKVIPAVRKLDLSNRPWENGYNLPSGPDDPFEDHPYLFSRIAAGRQPQFRIADLERMEPQRQANAAHPSSHAAILNEYGWLWLNRDGTPTELTRDVWDTILGPKATNEQRLKEWTYLLGGITEFWRHKRLHAGVLHFVYLTCSFPGVFTSDHWRDVEKLELDPDFADYVGEAFKPVSVYLNFWQPSVKRSEKRRIAVSMINDDHEPVRGRLELQFGKARQERRFELNAYGQHSWMFEIDAPLEPGQYTISATAYPDGTRHPSVVSRRKTTVQ